MGTGADITSTGAHPQYERCPPAIITGANTYKYSERIGLLLHGGQRVLMHFDRGGVAFAH